MNDIAFANVELEYKLNHVIVDSFLRVAVDAKITQRITV